MIPEKIKLIVKAGTPRKWLTIIGKLHNVDLFFEFCTIGNRTTVATRPNNIKCNKLIIRGFFIYKRLAAPCGIASVEIL